jgi:hypothetical protein
MATRTPTKRTTRPAKRSMPRLSGEQLAELLALIGGSDSVELKATLPAEVQRSATGALDVDPLEAQIRQVFFFDTPDLALERAGLVVRARRIQGRRGDTVVKLRPVVPEELPENVRTSESVKVEVDAMPGGFVCSASMRAKAANEDVRATAQGERPLRKLLTKEQRRFFAANAPEGIDLDSLGVLGPVFVLKLVLEPRDYGRRLVGEMWLLPDGSRILELSTKCAPAETFDVAARTRVYLEGLGLELSPDPHTKTKATLQFFAGETAAPAAAG